jgi:RES domain-containing protein
MGTIMSKTYDVSLSFAGEDRVYVSQVATVLQNAGVKVFYDEFEKTQLWGKDLIDQLGRIYRDDSEVVVMFVSRAYREKDWTNYERRNALSTQLQSKQEYVLPVRFDDTVLEGLPQSVAYLDGSKIKPSELGALIVSKLEHLGVRIKPSRQPRQKGLVAWRIGNARYAGSLAESAKITSRIGGRWNAPGTPVLYTASSYCAALLEVIPHFVQMGFASDLLATAIRVPDTVSITTLYEDVLPIDWRECSAEDTLRQLTSEWIERSESCVLSVPAATIPYERALLMNPAHVEFSQLEVITREPVNVDSRLFGVT